jgi:hypothetical protein
VAAPHVGRAWPDLEEGLGVISHPAGELIVVEAPGTQVPAGRDPHLAHPLLVYSELQIPG